MSFDVFISYSSRDRDAAETVRKALTAAGWRCWMAPHSIEAGAEWAEMIEHAIRHSAVLVVIFSERSNASKHVRREITLGDECGCPLIPYRIEPVFPQGALRYFLCATHWLDATTGADGPCLQQLCDAVAHGLALAPPHPPNAGQSAHEVNDHAVSAVEHRLVELMLQQGQVAVNLESLSEEERQVIQVLATRGVLAWKPSLAQPEGRFVAPANPSQCDRLLLQWLAGHPDRSSAGFLADVRRLPLLAGSLGRYLAEASISGDRRCLEELVQAIDPEAEAIVSTAVLYAKSCPQTRVELPQLVVDQGSYPAARGLASAAQQCIETHEWDLAQMLLSAVNRWGQGREPTAEESAFLIVDIANEQGRLWRRQGELVRAEAQLREAYDRAEEFSDPVLAGVVAINLARVLLDQQTPSGVAEARHYLLYAVDQLSGPEHERYLAAAYHNLGDAYAEEDPELAESYFQRDAAICRRRDDVHDQTDALDRLGVFLADRGRHQEAIEVLREAELLFPRYGDPRRQARVLANLGRAYMGRAVRQAGFPGLSSARDILSRSCTLLSLLDEPRWYAPALENLGRTQYLLGETDAGIATLKQSIRQYRLWPQGTVIAAKIQRELEKVEGASR